MKNPSLLFHTTLILKELDKFDDENDGLVILVMPSNSVFIYRGKGIVKSEKKRISL